MATDNQLQSTNATSVTVRMYRGLLGDCFLLTHSNGEDKFHALIDCGVLQCIGSNKDNTKTGIARMEKVVANLAKDTGGILDLVIATHEHYDHLSGFLLHFDTFKDFTIRSLWLAWTENDKDDLANMIREKQGKGLRALNALVEDATATREAGATRSAKFGLALDKSEVNDTIDSIQNLLQFYGEVEPQETSGSALGAAPQKPRLPKIPPRSCADVLHWLKQRTGPDTVEYLEPGQQIRFGLDNRLMATVLGPPRRADRLLQLDPTRKLSEVYLTLAEDVDSMLGARERPVTPRDNRETIRAADPELPFTERFVRWQGVDDADLDLPGQYYYDDESENRRIDGDWLGTAEALALKIDGDVNNTSLALAIELPNREVFLFPADAQVGNWLSWHDQKYPSKRDEPNEQGESATSILSRVVLYKVGHHGSHNATARALGLELMTNPLLCAMIPVVEEVAKEQKTSGNPTGWAMPYDKLYTRLKEMTGGRIVRGDGKTRDEIAAFEHMTNDTHPNTLSLGYADQSSDPLWVSLTRWL